MYYYIDIIEKIPLNKGWSADKKYRAITASGESYLLRIGPLERTGKLWQQHLKMQKVARLGIPMSLSLENGTCAEGPYLIQSWIDGVDAEEALPRYSEAQQYAYGLEAGRILRKIHSIPAPSEGTKPWGEYFGRKIDRKLKAYGECPLKYDRGEELVDFIQSHRHLLSDRPQTFQHGDYHCGNMMIDKEGQLTIIDFDKWDYGDPWEEFNRIVWCARTSPAFASGRIDGYFEGDVPEEFWQLLALYISSNTLSSLPWAIPFGEGEIQTMTQQAAEVLTWYDGMKNPVPTWYR
jgi:aminoglycoside phosphotransferase (APT) family kinase protein